MKCRRCGLVNYKTDPVCKRCEAPLRAGSRRPPPELIGEAWRDSSLLVLKENAELPSRCMKCNSNVGVREKTMTLSYYPKYNLALLVVGLVFSRTYKVKASWCERDLWIRRASIILSVTLMVGGSIGFIGGSRYALSGALMITAICIFSVGAILGASIGTPVSIEKVQKPFMWIKGASVEYLAGLPQWTKR